MSDFTEGIVKDALDKFRKACASDEDVERLYSILSASTSYDDAYRYAQQIGGHMAKVLAEVFESFGEEGILYGTARQILEPTMKALHGDIAEASAIVQGNKYAANGIRIATTTAEWHPYYSADIAQSLAADGGDLEPLLIQYAQRCVDWNQQANIELSTSLGFEIVIIRKYDHVGVHTNKEHPDPCEWCISRQGTKRFESYRECQFDEIWDRHPGCGCTIDYSNRKTGTRDKDVTNYHMGDNPGMKIMAQRRRRIMARAYGPNKMR